MYMRTTEAINETLKVLGASGFSGVSVTAKSPLLGLTDLLKTSPASKANPEALLHELRRQGLVHVSAEKSKIHYTITPGGVHRLQNVLINELSIEMPKKWDGKWRLITFDIPLSHSKQRAAFVRKLQTWGFMMLQKSVWVHPADCSVQIEELASFYNVFRYCSLLEVSLADELTARRLHRHFSLLLPSTDWN